MLELEELKTERNLRDYADRNLKRDGRFYHCPVCGSNHKKATLSIDGNLFHCFYGTCDAAGSVIDLIKFVENKDNKEAIKRARELYDPDYDPYWTPQKAGRKTTASKPTTTAAAKREGDKTMNTMNGQQPTNTDGQETPRRDFRNYFKKCKKRIYDTDYPRRRGLDEEIVKQFNLGYDPEWISPTAEYKRKLENAEIEKQNKRREREGQPPLPLRKPFTPSPRLIIPIGRHNYLARDTRPDNELTDAQKQYKKANEGKDKPFFNLKAIENPLYFIVTEGELDCLSILQAGGNCLALGSTARAKSFGELLKQQDAGEMGTVVIALDNDTAGTEATEKIVTACEIAGLEYVTVNAAGKYKDPNDFLVNDRQGFYKTIQGIVAQVRAEKLADYQEGNAAHAAKRFMNRPNTAGEAIPTGFDKVDEFLDGGLCSGLVFIGGLSSLGKTTLALQIGEYIAMDTKKVKKIKDVEVIEEIPARDVLYFALEQSEDDLMSKILSRRTYLASIAAGHKDEYAKTNIQLLHRNQWTKWKPQAVWDNFWKCYETFQKEAGEHFRIIESPGDISAADIVKMTERHIAITGRTPGAIIVDYLQILKPIDDRATDKQAIDRTITTLKRLSRDYDMTVIGISSFNRENYWQKVSLSAFKDSGNLEYSADILLAIAPAGMKDASGDKEKNENKNIVEKCKDNTIKNLQLHVLKNRNGKTTGKTHKLYFEYHSLYNYFKESDGHYLDYFDDGNPAAGSGTIV